MVLDYVHGKLHHHHQANMQLGHLLTQSHMSRILFNGLPLLPKHTSSFCLLVCSFLICSVIYYEAFCLNVANNFFCIPVFLPKLGSCLVLLQSVCLFYNLSNCILLFVSYISSPFISVITEILILFSFKVLSNPSSSSPSHLTFQAAYLNCSTYFISKASSGDKMSSFFL